MLAAPGLLFGNIVHRMLTRSQLYGESCQHLSSLVVVIFIYFRKMILAGPKSYYDEYIRKQGTGRTLNDPPSLLTDRGAYVNFLEVQLERVSAACLGAQSYEERFNDVQTLIDSLDQRCSQTTKLLGLAQQCIEVRIESCIHDFLLMVLTVLCMNFPC
jgi:hypothetical protein